MNENLQGRGVNAHAGYVRPLRAREHIMRLAFVTPAYCGKGVPGEWRGGVQEQDDCEVVVRCVVAASSLHGVYGGEAGVEAGDRLSAVVGLEGGPR